MLIVKRNGIITALITSLSKDGELCVDCLKQLIEFQYKNGVQGLFLTGTYGEGVILPKSIRLKVFEKALELSPKDMYLLPHIGSASIDTVIELGKNVKDLGYKEVSIVAPPYHRPSKKGLAEFFNHVASKIELDIIIYNNPGRVGYNITPDDFQYIVDNVKSVKGIKDTSRDVDQLLEYAKRFKDKYFIAAAGDSFMFYAFAIGIPAHICGISNLIPEVASKLYSYVLKGDLTKALELQYQVNRLRKVLTKLSNEVQEAIRELLKFRGIDAGYPPVQMIQEFDSRSVEVAKRVLDEVLQVLSSD